MEADLKFVCHLRKDQSWKVAHPSDIRWLFCSWLRSVTLSCNFVSWDSILQLGTWERWLDCYCPQETNHPFIHLIREHSDMTSHFLEGCFPFNNTEAWKLFCWLFVAFLLWLWSDRQAPKGMSLAYQHHRSLNCSEQHQTWFRQETRRCEGGFLKIRVHNTFN